jgi:hypothetical protein
MCHRRQLVYVLPLLLPELDFRIKSAYEKVLLHRGPEVQLREDFDASRCQRE